MDKDDSTWFIEDGEVHIILAKVVKEWYRMELVVKTNTLVQLL